MGSPDAADVAVTTLFILLGIGQAWRAVVARRWQGRASAAAHVIMCAAMAIMPWPPGMRIPGAVPLIVFSALALGYIGLALFDDAAARGIGHGRTRLVYHAVMMAAMSWMAVVMSAMTGGAGHHQHERGTMISLWALNGWIVALTSGLILFFAVAAILWFVWLLRPGVAAHQTPDTLIELGMALGMAAGILLMN